MSKNEKDNQIEEIIETLRRLSPIQVRVIRAIISRFAHGFIGEHLRKNFLSPDAYAYFGMRLTAHHAYSDQVMKKENFEHILAEAFRIAGSRVVPANSMTVRGADLTIDGSTLSLKTEASAGLRQNQITISKLMEAAWIKQITELADIPRYISAMVLPHFENYDQIFILRAYVDPAHAGNVRYDLREIPKHLLLAIGDLTARDFSPLTRTRTTSAEVRAGNISAFRFRLDGSDDKLTITNLDVNHCPLHAWWSLRRTL